MVKPETLRSAADIMERRIVAAHATKSGVVLSQEIAILIRQVLDIAARDIAHLIDIRED